ncbi:MAG: hypothetical protein E7370_00155 [Clostridiales bacterium]|nr:hypothetical protein [Clostridiales bacterium]
MAIHTKRSNTRKRIVAVVAIFLALALITTGIASWLILSDGQGKLPGGVHIAEVAESAIEFKDLKLNNGEKSSGGVEGAHFVFEPQRYDDDGRVKWNGVSYECLTVSVSGTVLNAQYMTDFYYTLALPQGVIEAAKKGYIDVSDYYDVETDSLINQYVGYSSNNFEVLEDGSSMLRFSFEVKLKWGDAFNKINPSVYFDTAYYDEFGNLDSDAGAGVENSTVISVLNDLYTTVKSGFSAMPQFTVTLVAEV